MFISVRGREDWEPGEAWESHRLVPPHQAHHLVHPGREAEIRRGGNWDQAPGRVAGIRLGVGEMDQALSWEAQNRAASLAFFSRAFLCISKSCCCLARSACTFCSF